MDKDLVLKDFIDNNKGDGIILFNEINRYWLSNLKTSFGVFIINNKNEKIFITDSRYINIANQTLKNSSIVWMLNSDQNSTLPLLIEKAIGQLNIKNLLVENEYITLQNYNLVKKYNHIPVNTMWLRQVKSNDEIKILQKSADVVTQVIKWLWEWIKPGYTEKEVAKKICIKILELGASGNSFDPIVSAGLNGSNPHHKPSDYVIQDGDMVTIDIGAMFDNYASDITRTFIVGSKCNNPEMLEIYDVVKNAQEKGVVASKKGAMTNDVDKICRDYIDNSKYKGLFGHGTGHGVGLEVHEQPNVSPSCKVALQNNNVVTIEPGIYKVGVGGVRIEDTIVISNNEPIILTKDVTKELIFINNK